MKIFNYWYLNLVVLLSLGSHSCAQNKVTFELKDDEKLIGFTTDRFTLPSLHVTPDGKNIIFDVLGDIYQVSIEGGKAQVLLQDNNWNRGAKLSPDGKTLAYVSDEAGDFQVWTYNLESKEKQVYPIKESFHYPLSAYWNRNGKLLIPSEEGLKSYDVLSGNGKILRKAKEEERNIMHNTNRKMTVDKKSSNAFYQFDGALWAYDLNENIDKYVGEFKEKRKETFVHASPNGKRFLYFATSKESPNMMDLVSWNIETNSILNLYEVKDLGFTTNMDYSYDFINDTNIVLDKEGQVVRMDIETGEFEPILIEVDIKKKIKIPLRKSPHSIKDSIITGSVLRNPITKSDLDTIYFGAFAKLHSFAKSTGVITEMYSDEDRFEVSPNLSSNGKYLAFTTWNDTKMGHVYARELKTGKEYQLTKIPGRYINPAWSPDGTEIVFVADETETKMGLRRQSAGANTSNYHLDLHRLHVAKEGKVQEHQESDVIYRLYPFSILPRRFYPIPVYHPKDKSVFITTRSHEKELPVLVQIDLDTKKIIYENLIPFHTDEVLVSPTAEYISFIYDEQVWVDEFPFSLKLEFSKRSEFINKRFHYKRNGVVDNILLPKAESVYAIAPSYMSWKDENTLLWGSAEEVYTYDVRTGETEKIADINVQKSKAIPETKYALTNAKIITINENDDIIKEGNILINNNRIEAVGTNSQVEIPKNYKVFDLAGKTIIPGLIDVHAHYHHAPYEFQWQQNYKYVGNLAYGITTIYDPSVNVLDYRERAQMVETGQLLGPRVFASGNIINGFPGTHEYDYKVIESLVDAKRIIESNKKLNVNGPLKEYGITNKKKRNKLTMASESITSHQSNYILALDRIVNGYTAIEHEIGSFTLHKDVTELIGQSGVNYTPTYVIRPGVKDIYINQTRKEINKFKILFGSVTYHNDYRFLFETLAEENKANIDSWVKVGVREHDRAISTLEKIVKARGVVSTGGHGNPLPGIGTHWELWFMAKGMSNYQALKAATINGAEKLDLQEEIGSIEEGKLADLVILNSDPLESIFNTTDILYTIQNGNIYEAETMMQIHPIQKELAPWGWDSPTVLESMESIYKHE